MTDTPDNTDEAKGRVKEAAGSVAGDDDLKQEGKEDQAEGNIKSAVDDATDKVKDVADSAADKAKSAVSSD